MSLFKQGTKCLIGIGQYDVIIGTLVSTAIDGSYILNDACRTSGFDPQCLSEDGQRIKEDECDFLFFKDFVHIPYSSIVYVTECPFEIPKRKEQESAKKENESGCKVKEG